MLVYYDFETTGLNQFHDKITEYCFIKENTNNDTLCSLVNPQKDIPDIVTRITGITKEMIEQYPAFPNHINQIMEFVTSLTEVTYFIAHNGDNYDFIMFKEHLKSYNYVFPSSFKSIDTLLLAKKLYPHLKKYSLVPLCSQLGCCVQTAHRAEGDSKMVRSLYQYILNDLSGVLGTDYNTLLNNPEIVYEYLYRY